MYITLDRLVIGHAENLTKEKKKSFDTGWKMSETLFYKACLERVFYPGSFAGMIR